MIAIIVIDRAETCVVALARVDWHLQAADLIEMLAEYPDAMVWDMAAVTADERGLPIAGPLGMRRTCLEPRHDG